MTNFHDIRIVSTEKKKTSNYSLLVVALHKRIKRTVVAIFEYQNSPPPLKQLIVRN